MEALKNTEDWCMAREDDTGETRTRFFCLKCPLEEDCSASSWKNAKAWSYQGEWEVRCYVYRHLTTSSKHNMSAIKAQTMAWEIMVETEEETFEDGHKVTQLLYFADECHDKQNVRKKAPLLA